MDYSVLIICEEDHKDWERVASYIKKKGYLLITASSVKKAIGILGKKQINIVIFDYNMPKINTLSVLRNIKTEWPSVEVIFLCKNPSLSKGIEAMKAGAYDFYEFPVNYRLLITIIEKAIEKQTLFIQKLELERRIEGNINLGNVVGRSKSMQNVMDIVRSVAPKKANILLTGESGTGKEMIASLIHYNSSRSSGPFIKINCAAFSEGVLESELFGHEKGAFTGAITKRLGRFELSHNGTIFLDEVGDMPLSMQIKLLRVLQEKEFERVGGTETIKVDIRVIAATHQNLNRLIEEGKFRKDLYYRLNVVHIELPPLRERKDDIPILVSTFINKFNEEKDYNINGITKDAMQILLNYSWPGNVRELENALESAMALSEVDVVEAKYLPSFLLLTQPKDINFYQLSQDLTLAQMESEIIKFTLEKTEGNKSKAARLLGIGLRTLQRKVKDI
jgi:DNA-binding NtrC family response regulator